MAWVKEFVPFLYGYPPPPLFFFLNTYIVSLYNYCEWIWLQLRKSMVTDHPSFFFILFFFFLILCSTMNGSDFNI